MNERCHKECANNKTCNDGLAYVGNCRDFKPIEGNSIRLDKPVIRAIVCHDIFPSPPEWDKQIGRLKFYYKDYYMSAYYNETMLGYFDCPDVDGIREKKDFEQLCISFAKRFYNMLSSYMSY